MYSEHEWLENFHFFTSGLSQHDKRMLLKLIDEKVEHERLRPNFKDKGDSEGIRNEK